MKEHVFIGCERKIPISGGAPIPRFLRKSRSDSQRFQRSKSPGESVWIFFGFNTDTKGVLALGQRVLYWYVYDQGLLFSVIICCLVAGSFKYVLGIVCITSVYVHVAVVCIAGMCVIFVSVCVASYVML